MSHRILPQSLREFITTMTATYMMISRGTKKEPSFGLGEDNKHLHVLTLNRNEKATKKQPRYFILKVDLKRPLQLVPYISKQDQSTLPHVSELNSEKFILIQSSVLAVLSFLHTLRHVLHIFAPVQTNILRRTH